MDITASECDYVALKGLEFSQMGDDGLAENIDIPDMSSFSMFMGDLEFDLPGGMIDEDKIDNC